jgi:hypothetical protein
LWPTVALLVIAAAVAGCTPGKGTQVLATILEVHGPVVVVDRRQNKLQAAAGSYIEAGSIIETGADCEIIISLLPGIRALFGPKTRFAIDDLRIGKDGNETSDTILFRHARITLFQGSVTSAVAPVYGKPEITLIAHHVEIIGVSGSVLKLVATADGFRATGVKPGLTVRASNGNREAVLRENSLREFDRAGNEIRAVDDAHLDEEARSEIGAALSAERRMTDLEKLLHKSPPPWRRKG